MVKKITFSYMVSIADKVCKHLLFYELILLIWWENTHAGILHDTNEKAMSFQI